MAIPCLYFLNLILIYKTPGTLNLPYLVVVVGILISFLGLGLWFLSYLNLGKSFGVLPRVQERIKKGVYRYFRHPMYIGIILAFFGLSIADNSKIGVVFTLLVITPILLVRAKIEEKLLIK